MKMFTHVPTPLIYGKAWLYFKFILLSHTTHLLDSSVVYRVAENIYRKGLEETK